ncbi:hypothetical protein AZE42_07744 [Rhizopogon vesiculosus]|uniref:Uncharacterized protein n=1 Tax=Rhizopogon vesiculosus TaxID=180088 RepID=A0A1J8QY16_9AGAM|nr:hypothetical protein AZE42_07744 [Rhizopogon vesiculosus]
MAKRSLCQMTPTPLVLLGQSAVGTGAGVSAPHPDSPQSASARGNTAFTSDRPLGVQPMSEGGVAVGGQPDLPEGHAGLGDKIIGKTQKVDLRPIC